MEQNNRQQGAALTDTAPKQGAKNPTTATAVAEGRELTTEEAAALGLAPSQRYTYYFFEKKGGCK